MGWKMRPILGGGGFLPPTDLMRGSSPERILLANSVN